MYFAAMMLPTPCTGRIPFQLCDIKSSGLTPRPTQVPGSPGSVDRLAEGVARLDDPK